jgi:hypothetical protein
MRKESLAGGTGSAVIMDGRDSGSQYLRFSRMFLLVFWLSLDRSGILVATAVGYRRKNHRFNGYHHPDS